MKTKLLLFLMLSVSAFGQSWSPWQSLGSGVSISVSQVNHTTWTWKFRNDGPGTITYMEFAYTDSEGDHKGGLNVLPTSLKQGEVHGGWTSFTASSLPQVRIVKIERK